MKVLVICVLMVTFIGTLSHCADNNDEDDEQLRVSMDGDNTDDDLTYAESVRNVRLIDNSEWRGVQRIHIEDDRPLEARPQKRRRLRKRKRRPQHIQQQQLADDDQVVEIVRPRRRRPIRLDEIDDDWKKMEAESPHRAYSRRRVGAIYQQEDVGSKFEDGADTPHDLGYKSHGRNEPSSSTSEPTTALKDIKDILKQTGGLSLSEILLEKNLTLSDLLRGNQNALLALSERPLQTATEREVNLPVAQTAKGPMRPPYQDESSRKDEQRKRLPQLYSGNKMYSEITTKYDVVTEATTEKRIFVPSHPKYYTSVNYKPEFDLVTEAPKRTTLRLPMTSAQMNMKIKKADGNNNQMQQIPLSEIFSYENTRKSNNVLKGPLKMSFDLEEIAKQNTISQESNSVSRAMPDLSSSSTMKLTETTTEQIHTTTTPMTSTAPTNPISSSTVVPTTATILMTNAVQFEDINFGEEVEMTTINDRPTSAKLTTTQRFSKKLYATSKPAVTTLQPKKLIVSAKDEIMEAMANREVKDELSKILTSRNMTFEELVEQRERGSSQRHLAEIFHNKTKEPEPTQIVEEINTVKYNIGLISKYNTTSNRQPKVLSTSTTSTTTTTTTTTTRKPQTVRVLNPNLSPLKPLEDVSMSSEEIMIAERLPSTSFPTYKIETNKASKEIPPLHIPIWKTIYPSIYIESERNDKKQELDAIEQSIRQAVDADLNEISRSNNNLNEYDDYIQLPIGVKSAIYASLAIIGMSLVLFLTILVIFRWSQKHKKRLCYGGSGGSTFTCSKIKSPILQQHEPAKRTIRTFVSETLGKRRNFYAQQFRQSMSDSWESNERPYQ